MSYESNIFGQNYLFLKVLGSFLALSVLDPVIFDGLEQSDVLQDNTLYKIIIYNLFLIGYSTFPILILIWYWYVFNYKVIIGKTDLKPKIRIAFFIIILIAIGTFALPSVEFIFWLSVIFVAICGVGIYKLLIWYRNSFDHKINSEKKLGLTIILIIIIINTVLNIGFLHTETEQNEKKRELKEEKQPEGKEQVEEESELDNGLFLIKQLNEFYKKDSDLEEINEKITNITEKGIKNAEEDKSKLRKDKNEINKIYQSLLKQIIELNRTKQILVSSFILLFLLILYLFLRRYKPKSNLDFSLKAVIGIYFFSIISLAKPVNSSLTKKMDKQSLYFVDNWYLPQNISSITKNSINKGSYESVTNNYDSIGFNNYEIKEINIYNDSIKILSGDTSIIIEELKGIINDALDTPKNDISTIKDSLL